MANKKVAAEILDDAVNFVEQGWTKYSMARDHNGYPVPFHHANACYYCIDGAIARAAWDRGDFVNDVLAIRAVEEKSKCRMGTLNDELLRTSKEATTILREAASDLRGKVAGAKSPPADEKKRRPRRTGVRS